MPDTVPNIISVIRTLRELRDLDYADARDTAIEMYRDKGWPIPLTIESLYGRPFMPF